LFVSLLAARFLFVHRSWRRLRWFSSGAGRGAGRVSLCCSLIFLLPEHFFLPSLRSSDLQQSFGPRNKHIGGLRVLRSLFVFPLATAVRAARRFFRFGQLVPCRRSSIPVVNPARAHQNSFGPVPVRATWLRSVFTARGLVSLRYRYRFSFGHLLVDPFRISRAHKVFVGRARKCFSRRLILS
jgi:hypothetical protein